MKKTILAIVITAVAVTVWFKLDSAKLNLSIFQGATATIRRADLSIPITATGEIQPKQRIEIKPEASGTISEIPLEPGAIVKAGDLIMLLDPENEQRSVTRAQYDVDRAQATLEQQKLRLEARKTSDIDQLNAQKARIDAQIAESEFRYNKTKNLFESKIASEDEWTQVKSAYDQLKADQARLEADFKQARIAIQLAEKDVKLAENAFETAKTNLSDAEKRLRETKIESPIDGMIASIPKGIGEVVQGGMTTITGGTVLAVVADVSDIYVRTEVADADIGAVMWLAPESARPGGKQLALELGETGVAPLVSTNGVVGRLNAEGTPVEILVDAVRDQTFKGIIERIFPEPKKAQNIITYLVDIKVTSTNRKLLELFLGMQADVEFTAEAVEDAILVPHDAIRRGPTGELGVFVPQKDAEGKEGEPLFVPCRFGLDNGLFAQLVEGEGIREGVEVYTKLPPRFGKDDDKE